MGFKNFQSKEVSGSSLSWDEGIGLVGEDKGEVVFGLEEPAISFDMLIRDSGGFLFSLPLENLEQPTENLNIKGKPGRKANFTLEEDAQLEELVGQYGESKWSVIASIMTKWNRKQLRERYINFIKGRSTSTNFTPTEDATILEHIKKHGRTWKELVTKLSGRSPIAVKNRYYKTLVKKNPPDIPLLLISDKDMKGDGLSGRISTKGSSVNEKLCEEQVILENKVQILLQQEQKFIETIKKIETKLSSLTNDIKRNS
jgi:hypothetical protein